MLCASCADHKQSKHMFFIALLSCYSLHSCGAQHSESTESDYCLTSRRLHHCWASCLEMLMLLCGFFRTLGQHFSHQISFLCCPIPASALFSVQSIFHEWQAWGFPKVLEGNQDVKWNMKSIGEERRGKNKKYTHCWHEKSCPGRGSGREAQQS